MIKIIEKLENLERYHLKMALPLLIGLLVTYSVTSKRTTDSQLRDNTKRSLEELLEPSLVSGDLIQIYRTINSFERTIEGLKVCLVDNNFNVLYGSNCSDNYRKLDFKFYDAIFHISITTSSYFIMGVELLFILIAVIIIFFIGSNLSSLINILSNDLNNVQSSSGDHIKSSEFKVLNVHIQEKEALSRQVVLAQKEKDHAIILRSIAHDLRSPLAVIEHLLKEIDIKTERENLFQSATDSIKNITETLLRKSRVKEEGYRSLHELLLKIVEAKSFEHQRINARIQLWNQTSVYLPNKTIQSLGRIISNMINNSIEAIDKNRTPNVKISVQVIESNLQINILDNGIGVAPENQHLLFSKNFTTKDRGNGIGLFDGREILKRLEGDIEYMPQTVGAGFLITLPLETTTSTNHSDITMRHSSEPQHFQYSSEHSEKVLQ